jgi:hypothetical protein
MTDEEKQAVETAKAEAEAIAQAEKEAADAEFEASLEGLSDEEKAAKLAEKEAQNVDNKPDYDAELKKERDAREKAEKALAEKRFKDSQNKKRDDDPEDLDKPLTRKELQEVLISERQENQKIIQSTRIDTIAKSLSGSEAEKNLIIEIHKNRTFPSHLSLEEQLEESYVIANRKKLIGERNEALRALKGKDGVNRNPATTHQETRPGSEPKIAPQDAQAFKDAGFVWNGTSRQYEKKLSNGDLLVRDSKTKQTRIIKKS